MPVPKKILYIITKSGWGGAQRYVQDLAVHLPRDQFHAVAAMGARIQQRGTLFDMLEAAGIRTIAIASLGRDIGFMQDTRSLWEIFSIIKKEKPDVVHLNSSKVGGIGALAARLASLITGHRPLIIFTVHGWGFHEDRSRLARILIYAASWISSCFHDRVIVLDRTDYDAGRRFIPKRKLTLIPNGIEGIHVMPRAQARAALAEKIGRDIADNTILIGTIAELTKNKGLSYLVSAIKALPQYYGSPTSIILGSGEYQEQLQKQIDSLKLANKVFLAGFIPDASRYLEACDIFVLPSLKEGLPYALMEAMAAGLPAVATRVGGIPDLIEDGIEGMLVPPKDAPALTHALGALIEDPHLRRRLGISAHTKIKTTFTFRAMLEHTIHIYEADHHAHQ